MKTSEIYDALRSMHSILKEIVLNADIMDKLDVDKKMLLKQCMVSYILQNKTLLISNPTTTYTMTRTYYYDEIEKTITIKPSLKTKVKDGIRVYFYREIDERKATDYPIATATLPKSGCVDWVYDVKIFRVEIKRPILFGLLGYKWEIAEPSLHKK